MTSADIQGRIQRTAHMGGTSPWDHCKATSNGAAERQALAELIAVQIAALRNQASMDVFELWRKRRDGEIQALVDTDREVVVAHVLENVGTPDAPASADHLEGLVAEHLWYGLTDAYEGRLGLPVRVDPPSWSVTDHGLDELAIYRRGDVLVFRLWEIKRHDRDDTVRSTVNTACNQLNLRAMKYLARHATVGQHDPDPEVADLYSKLSRYWADKDERAGVGVGVMTSEGANTENAFEPLALKFTLSDEQREGLVGEIPDFPQFAELVRSELWKGL